MSSPPPPHTNRLARSTSPYLLQHAHNPVDWYPWGEEALARARAEDRPILLSIGYSSCHWCHVMERESFENEDTARLMNDGFVCIKVDREERPDLDDIYMAATLAMNQGQGGWPMTVFLTPDQQPFFAGTYFPPEDRWGRPGFPTVLQRIAQLWKTDRAAMGAQAEQLVEFLRQNTRPAPGGSVGEDDLRQFLASMTADFDARFGGFGPAPKFPPSTGLSLLLRCHRRFGDAQALEMVRRTLEAMAQGGLYDQVGGGFHRYSTDEHWLVPHFEKMLYDNALLARVYLEAHQATGDLLFARIARETLDYVRREMTGPEGGFHSATDADSEGEEGRFFVWTPEEVEQALGDPELARRFCTYYDVSDNGNWEGKSVPNTTRTGVRTAKFLGVPEAELERSVAEARAKLYEARKSRVAPGLDDKVLTAWNGLMISAFAEGHRVLRERAYLETAERAADFLLATLRKPDGRLLRTWRQGTAHIDGFLEDYAYLANGLVDLYEAGGAERFLRAAEALAAIMRSDFAADEGGFFSTAAGHESLVVRHREGHDGAVPAANAVAGWVLARLSYHLDRDDLREDAERAVRAWSRALQRQPRAFPQSLIVVDLLTEGPTELAIAGEAAGAEPLWAEIARHYLPNRLVAHDDGQAGSTLPLLQGKGPVKGRPALYVCRDYACQAPVTDPAELAGALSAVPAPGGDGPKRVGPRPLPGRATVEGCARRAERHVRVHGWARLGSTGLSVSRVGFGGYRVDTDVPAHREALERALASGVNLIDTSTNYADGGSERLIGDVLADGARAGRVRRDEIVVVSKIGYVQGENMEIAQAREEEGRPFPEMVKYGDGIWHCIHPEFLEDQLARSLERLQLETLDVLLLHNPEYFLMDGHERSHGPLAKRREEFQGRLRRAFAWMQEQVKAGRIGAYGVSSNTVVRKEAAAEATSLASMLEAARAAGGEGHHFRVLQLPLNLLESGAVLENNHDLHPVLEHAAAHDVGVLVNRPLNAMVDDMLVRVADIPVAPAAGEVENLAEAAATLEEEFRTRIAPRLKPAEGGLPPEHFFRWSTEVAGVLPHVRSLDHWDQVEHGRIVPRLVEVMRVMDGIAGETGEAWRAWRRRYIPALQALMEAARRQAALRSAARAEAVEAVVDPLLPAERAEEPLARKALWVLTSTPGVSCVLLGMRTVPYVDDAVAVLSWPRLEPAVAIYEKLLGVSLPA